MRITTARRSDAVFAKLRSLVLPLVFGAVFGSATAHAADQKTAVVLEPKVTGMIEPLDLNVIEKAVATALQEQQFQVASKPERDNIISATGNLKNCYRNDCLEQLGRLLGAHLVLAYKIKVDFVGMPANATQAAPPPDKKGGKKSAPVAQTVAQEPVAASSSPLSFEITAALYNIEVGAIGARVDLKCAHCSGPQVGAQAADMVKRAVLEDASKQRELLEITSDPSNSSVLVDGVELGVTPYKRSTFVGKHEITVRHTGYKSTNQEITVSENRKSSVGFQLQLGQDPVKYIKEYQPRPKWRLGLGGALVGVGLVGIGFGAYGLAINHSCTEDPVPPALVCPTVRNSLPAGLGFLVGGAVVAVAGAVVMIIPGKRNSLTPEGAPDTFGDKDKQAAAENAAPRAALSLGGLGSGLGLQFVGTY